MEAFFWAQLESVAWQSGARR